MGTLLGIEVPAPGFAPAGQDPVAYVILYPIFGAVLLVPGFLLLAAAVFLVLRRRNGRLDRVAD